MEIGDDVKAECGKYGGVSHLFVDKVSKVLAMHQQAVVWSVQQTGCGTDTSCCWRMCCTEP